MRLDIQAFSLPKVGEAASTNQDRLAVNPRDRQFALSDGAGSSLYPAEWARLLSESFCEGDPSVVLSPDAMMSQWLPPLQQSWRQFYLQKLQSPSQKWWQGGSTTKSHGAATLLGLVLTSAVEKRWTAIAVGDSCLFQYRPQDQSLLSFPLKTAAAFKSTTACLASLPEYPSATPRMMTGGYEVGDYFVLATDALSQCILAQVEAKSWDWDALLPLDNAEAFQSVVMSLRQRRQLKNDDTSLIRIQILPED